MPRTAKQNITNRDCTKPVKARKKINDADCQGFYVSLSPTAPPTFSLKYTCPKTKQRLTHRLGIYHEDGDTTRDVAYWRVEAMNLKVRIKRGEDIARRNDRQAKQGLTVSELIDQRIAWMSEVVETGKRDQNDKPIEKPRRKDWGNMASHLERVRPRFGKLQAHDLKKRDMLELEKDIANGLLPGGKPSKRKWKSTVRHIRKAISGMYKWAQKETAHFDDDFVSPCANLPELPKESPKTRKLSPDEIRVLWHGLDRPDITVDRRICLAIKFALVSMLRSIELLHIHRDELGRGGLNSKHPLVIIPDDRVKAARVIYQPLSDMAVEIARESMGNYPWMFAGRWGTEPLNRKAMACALRGNKVTRKGKVVVRSTGLCEQLGLRPFTPHDLRRTAASLMGSIRVPGSTISRCLDHSIKSDEQGEIADVTGKHYDQDPRVEEKREALQKLADEIRRIISTPQEMRQAA